MTTTSITRISTNGYYSSRIVAFKKAMMEVYPNLTDDDFNFIISADENSDLVTVGIKNIDVDPNIFNLIYSSFFIDELPCIKENNIETVKEQKVYNIIKELDDDPTFLAVATALAKCVQIINS